MKKIILTLCLLFLITNTNFCNNANASEQESYYAKIQTDDVFFYSSQDENSSLFEIPKSYFVLLISSSSEEYYMAQYKDLIGYVKKDDVLVMDGTPKNPYPDVSLSLFVDHNIYKNPSIISSSLENIKAYDDSIIYYGNLNGEYVSNKSSLWYYSKYTKNNTDNYGYIYSVICNLSEIPLNTEYFNTINYDIFTGKFPKEKSKKLNITAKILIILGVSLPCAFIIYLLIKPTKIMEYSSARKNTKQEYKVKRRSHGDYFEFDESDL